ncbi:MAG: hypothetical protein G5701_09105 [Serratia symbiotica]|nr:hypothetical protein [Serratia symbiotica]
MINMVLSDSGVRDSICVLKIGINIVIENTATTLQSNDPA